VGLMGGRVMFLPRRTYQGGRRPLPWVVIVRTRRHTLIVHERSNHRVHYSERAGRRRWRYFGPVCWRVDSR
jgi:hypothetical protein